MSCDAPGDKADTWRRRRRCPPQRLHIQSGRVCVRVREGGCDATRDRRRVRRMHGQRPVRGAASSARLHVDEAQRAVAAQHNPRAAVALERPPLRCTQRRLRPGTTEQHPRDALTLAYGRGGRIRGQVEDAEGAHVRNGARQLDVKHCELAARRPSRASERRFEKNPAIRLAPPLQRRHVEMRAVGAKDGPAGTRAAPSFTSAGRGVRVGQPQLGRGERAQREEVEQADADLARHSRRLRHQPALLRDERPHLAGSQQLQRLGAVRRSAFLHPERCRLPQSADRRAAGRHQRHGGEPPRQQFARRRYQPRVRVDMHAAQAATGLALCQRGRGGVPNHCQRRAVREAEDGGLALLDRGSLAAATG
eukprot:4459113-Prymnesium_polylepis.1